MARKEWRPFPEARAFVRSLGLLDQIEWNAYARGDLAHLLGTRPEDIPSCPNRDYRTEGWAGMPDWLGPPPLTAVEPGYMDFKRARRFARSLGFASPVEWRAWCRAPGAGRPVRPANVPAAPERMYPRAWRGWKDWLGTERRPPASEKYLKFEKAREFARTLGLRNVKEWRAFCRGRIPGSGGRPREIPANPDNVYRLAGWISYGDWLGNGCTGSIHTPSMPYAEAREFVARLGMRGEDEHRAWTAGARPDLPPRPALVPSNPQRTYRDSGWVGWGEYLGTGNIHRRDRVYRPFEEARAWARSLGLGSATDWRILARGDLPDLGELPPDIPANPSVVYDDCGWTNWGDFLGTGNLGPGQIAYRDFDAAREFARTLGLTSVQAWLDWVHGKMPHLPPRPRDIPVSVEAYYRERGWRGWPNFLGYAGPVWEPLPFARAREISRSLGVRTRKEWEGWMRGQRPDLPPPPEDMPFTPNTAYRDHGWRGWGDFTGSGRRGTRGRRFDGTDADRRRLTSATSAGYPGARSPRST